MLKLAIITNIKNSLNGLKHSGIKPQAHKEKTIVLKDGSKTKIDFKEYLINEIERIFIKYTPREIYYKVLFEFLAIKYWKKKMTLNLTDKLGD